MKFLLAFWLALLLVVSLALALSPSAAHAQTVTPEPTFTPAPTATVVPGGYFTFTDSGSFTYSPAVDVFASEVVTSENSTTVLLVLPVGFGWFLSAVVVISGALVAKWAWSWVTG